jgi:hypothetical protein
MNGAVQLAVVAGLAEEFLDDLREEVRATMPKPVPEIDYALLADFVLTRIEPRLVLLEDRMRAVATDVSIMKMRSRRAR